MLNPNVRVRMHDLFDAPISKTFVNRTGAALAKGDIVAVDLTGSATEATTYTAYDANSNTDQEHPFSNVISVATAHLGGWVFAVAAEAVDDNAAGKFYLRGVVDVELVASGTATVAAGAAITAANGQTYGTAVADGNVTLGLALEANEATAGTKKVIFDGYQLSRSSVPA